MNIFYTVYQTTNTETGKFYIGVHKTKNPNDKYLGSGKYLTEAIKKYGRNVFKKDILFLFDNKNDAYEKEKELVTKDLINSGNVYNLQEGGIPTEDWADGRVRRILRGKDHQHFGKSNPDRNKRISEGLTRAYQETPRDPSCWEKMAETRRGKTTSLKGTKQTEEFKERRLSSIRNLPKKKCPMCGKETSPSNFKRHLLIHFV